MNRCKDCKHFTVSEDHAPFGACQKWLTGYGHNPAEMELDEALVEDDEGWGMLIGPEFGCVLWEAKA